MSFEFFDPDAPVDITSRFLPHWFQRGATYFVTFRTIDSLPASVLHSWLEERRRWFIAHGINPDSPNWQSDLQRLTARDRQEYHRTFQDSFHSHLDAGYGQCLLRLPKLSDIVASALLHFDGTRYCMADFVVMPNHVHALFGLMGDTLLSDVCRSWKRFTATRINDLMGRKGHFWQGESFDHIVRSPEQFEYIRGYIANNPRKANLKAGEYRLYQANFDHGPLEE